MRHRILLPLALAAALLTACSDSDSDPDSGSAAPQTSKAPAAGRSADGAPSPQEAAAGGEEVPSAAQAYVDAVAAEDLDALVDAFHPDARLIDVGREFNGRDEIRDWADDEVIGGRLTVLKNTPKPGGTTLLVRFAPGGTGGFEANYEFDVRDGRIAELNLQYA
ncbi:nuclear transport factor 2 family protein [Streptomyces sp. 13-12-16]|uniref:nuclear transport factor 2 family protein n=1 Tax=Streptomyces sp. 13-12-16 TaxID=1570823 RepID=UPI0015C42E3C|nr:nuclear transport factor 2 family protein [Streptomyces sp. 13-12-16]